MATIDELLRGAQLVRTADAPPRAGMELEHLAAWKNLARSARRGLDAVPGPMGEAEASIAATLKRLEAAGGRALASQGVEAESGILSVALRLGAVADLLVSERGRAAEPLDGQHLRGRIYATLYRTAAYTVPAIAPHRAGWQDVLELAHLTKPFRDVRQEAGGPLEDVAAPDAQRFQVENAAFRWERAASRALLEQPTRMAFESLAADMAILAASGTVLGVALRDRMPGVERQLEVMADVGQRAHRAWTGLSRWPDLMTYPGPRPHELNDASLHLREAVQGALRSGQRWLTPEELAAVNTPRSCWTPPAASAPLAAASRRTTPQLSAALSRDVPGSGRLGLPMPRCPGSDMAGGNLVGIASTRRGAPRSEPCGPT